MKLSSNPNEIHTNLLKEYFARINSNQYEDLVPVKFLQLLILGNGESGKTSVLNILRQLYSSKECETVKELNARIPVLPSESTHGNIHYYWELTFNDCANEHYTILVKDFGGQEYYHHFHPIFYHPQALYWITNSQNTNTDERKDNGAYSPLYWLENVNHYLKHHHEIQQVDGPQIWLLNTKVDLPEINQRENYNDIFAKNLDICSLSLKKFDSLPFLRRKSYLAVREQLYYEFRQRIENSSNEKMFKLSWDIFQTLKRKGQEVSKYIYIKEDFLHFLKSEHNDKSDIIEANFETILNDLRYLGICLYFPENLNLYNYIYLFPQKIAEGIFKDILSKENLEEKYGVLQSEKVGSSIELQKLLEHFEIIFRDGQTQKMIVPQYLPQKFEKEELIQLATDGLENKLVIEFANFMPQGIISRLICYFGQNPFKKWYWRTGILFTHNIGSRNDSNLRKALISTSGDGFTITIKANSIDEIEKIFLKVLLSYYNQPLNINDNLPQNDATNSQLIAFEQFIDKLKDSTFDASLSLNNGAPIAISALKNTIENIEDYSNHKSSYNPYTKVQQYLPFLRYLTDTKEFQNMFNSKKIFISYSHKDSDIRKAIDTHLKLMVRTGVVLTWHDMMIDVGTLWDEKIENELRSADIVILLLSSDFFASEYIWNKELPIIMEKLENGSCTVVPILCRHCISNVDDIFSNNDKDRRFEITKLQGLPIQDNKFVPIHSAAFPFIDEAYQQIAEKLMQIIKSA